MLTSQDLKQIEDLFLKFEERIIQRVDTMITTRIDLAVHQIKEYIDANIEAHEQWLNNHEIRIHNLEGNGYQVNDRKKRE